MATSSPTKPGLRIPIPPPQAHTRQTESPLTPTHANFISPAATPQGSPSKKQVPPGATDLPDIFEHAMRLVPTAGNPTKSTLQQFAPTSPTKGRTTFGDDNTGDLRSSVFQDRAGLSPSKLGKENAPPTFKAGQTFYTNPAVTSRQDVYKPREQFDSVTKSIPRGITPEALEKLSKPSVKRLANVTQLCGY